MNANKITKIRGRVNALQQWLATDAPEVFDEQKHLDNNTPERAYWHYGYLSALTDVLRAMED